MLDSGAAWALHPAVSVRPEPFGALLYHFGNRKLSFLKDRTLLAIVREIDAQPSLDAAFDACDVADAQRQRFLTAIQSLVASEIVVRRDDPVHTAAKETA